MQHLLLLPEAALSHHESCPSAPDPDSKPWLPAPAFPPPRPRPSQGVEVCNVGKYIFLIVLPVSYQGQRNCQMSPFMFPFCYLPETSRCSDSESGQSCKLA